MADSYPRPFYKDPWTGDQAVAAAAVWDWHDALRESASAEAELHIDDFLLEAERVRNEMTTRFVKRVVSERAKAAVDRFSLDSNLFAIQVEKAHAFQGPAYFGDYADLQRFADGWAVPVGRLLLAVAGSNRQWQVPWVDSLSRGYFLLGRLLRLPIDLEHHHVFLPADEMEFFGVSEAILRRGVADEPVRKLLWKQSVRIRDQFAQSLPLAAELPRRQSAAFKRWWLRGLELVSAIERKKYDLWSGPIVLSRLQRVQVQYQSRFGRLTFRSK